MKNLLIISAAAVFAPLILSAEGHSCIISGDPVAAATVNSKATASAGTALVSSARTFRTVASSLEARFRTMDESDGVGLFTYKIGMIISFR